MPPESEISTFRGHIIIIGIYLTVWDDLLMIIRLII